jgi:hypothetical protein
MDALAGKFAADSRDEVKKRSSALNSEQVKLYRP